MNGSYLGIIREGLWNNNPGLVQLLGLCPLLAISGTVVNALGLGIATIATLVISNTLVSLLREYVRPEIRIPVYVLIIASVVTAIELVMNAWFHGLFLVLGIFIPLIVTSTPVKPARCVRLSDKAACSTMPICCLANGGATCASRSSPRNMASCWHCCRQAHSSQWVC